jgi:hypothetical protein
VADVVQLIGVMAVVIEHIGQQRQGFLRAHGLRLIVGMVVGVVGMVVIVNMIMHDASLLW